MNYSPLTIEKHPRELKNHPRVFYYDPREISPDECDLHIECIRLLRKEREVKIGLCQQKRYIGFVPIYLLIIFIETLFLILFFIADRMVEQENLAIFQFQVFL